MSRWQDTYKKWRKGEDVASQLSRPTMYRHRAVIQRVYGVDIKDRQIGLDIGQHQLPLFSQQSGRI